MQIDSNNSLLTDVTVQLSPNCNDRPDEHDISLLVIHGISLPEGEFGGCHITDLFLNQLTLGAHDSFSELDGLEVSAHALIRRDGEIIQYVPFNKRAWHAGVSLFEGREGCNDYSIGIELEGCDDIDYTEQQYQQLARVTNELIKRYANITHNRIVGHSDIAPGRKTDPGDAFNWVYYKSLLTKEG